MTPAGSALSRVGLWDCLLGPQFGLSDHEVFDILSAVAVEGLGMVMPRRGNRAVVRGLAGWRYTVSPLLKGGRA